MQCLMSLSALNPGSINLTSSSALARASFPSSDLDIDGQLVKMSTGRYVCRWGRISVATVLS